MFASSDRRFVQFVDVARVQQFVSATNNKIRLIFKIGVATTCPLMILIDEAREVFVTLPQFVPRFGSIRRNT
jgi:hypothetical protein